MTVAELRRKLDLQAAGVEMIRFVAPMVPWLRSITGEGLRRTLRHVQSAVPLEVHEVPTGTPVLDWTVPDEWTLRAAWIKDPRGRTVIDVRDHNLHVVSYSAPVRARVTLAELKRHVHTLPERPEWIPYRTGYYRPDWGFCMSHEQLLALEDGTYEVCVDATLAPGSLSYGECLIPGAPGGTSPGEVLVSCHACHPALANDNLSGIAVAVWLARLLREVETRYDYRFLFAPGTIGAIAWLARNEATAVSRIRHGLVAACLGDPGKLHYKRTWRGDAEIDRAASHVLRTTRDDFEVLDFVPFGYDERQYNSPGFRLDVGSLTRTPHGRYPEYHTSADDLDFIRADALADSLDAYLAVFEVLEGNLRYRNRSPKGEPQLGRRGLYRAVGGGEDGRDRELALLWVLNLSDGDHALLDVAERAAMPFAIVREAADRLLAAGLLEPV